MPKIPKPSECFQNVRAKDLESDCKSWCKKCATIFRTINIKVLKCRSYLKAVQSINAEETGFEANKKSWNNEIFVQMRKLVSSLLKNI